MKLITVIVPIYNGEKYLAECLESICNNTYQNLEIICVDDGSTDGTVSIINDYQKYHSNIRLLKQKNSGVSCARNYGMRMAKGEYIAFIDADDMIADVYFESLFNAAETMKADIAACAYTKNQFDKNKRYNGNYVKYNQKEYYRTKQLRVYVWGKLYKREIVENIYFDTSICYAEDIAFSVNILCESIKNEYQLSCAMTDDEMYYYRQNPSSLSHIYQPDDWIPLCNWLDNKSFSEKNKAVSSLYIYESLKKCLVAEYEKYLLGNYTISKTTKNHFRDRSKKLSYIPGFINSKEYILFSLFAKYPQLYIFARNKLKI